MNTAGHVVRQAGSRRASSNSSRSQSVPKSLVLITHGSMNPVHRGHIEMMLRARAALEELGHRVCGGEIAITRQQHTISKGCSVMHDDLRLALLSSAIAEYNSLTGRTEWLNQSQCGEFWLRATNGSKYGSASQYIRGEHDRLRKFFGDYLPAIVQGSDVLLRYPPGCSNKKRMLVVVTRHAEADAAECALVAAGYTLNHNAVLLPADELATVSSTVARSALSRGDVNTLRRCCGNAVAGHLLQLTTSQVYAHYVTEEVSDEVAQEVYDLPVNSLPPNPLPATTLPATADPESHSPNTPLTSATLPVTTIPLTAFPSSPSAPLNFTAKRCKSWGEHSLTKSLMGESNAPTLHTAPQPQISSTSPIPTAALPAYNPSSTAMSPSIRPPHSLRATLEALRKQPAGVDAVRTLREIVTRAINHPDEPKYRQLRISNRALQDRLLSLNGGSEALAMIGFKSDGEYLRIPIEFRVESLRCAGHAIQMCMEAAGGQDETTGTGNSGGTSGGTSGGSTIGGSTSGGSTSGGSSGGSTSAGSTCGCGTSGGAGVGTSEENAVHENAEWARVGLTAGVNAAGVNECSDHIEPMSARMLRARWSRGSRQRVCGFYSHKESSGALRVFSNFYEHAPFDFCIPVCCGCEALISAGRSRTVPITFGEKGIMLCKAAAMGDMWMFDEILKAPTPAKAKSLGRAVTPWDQDRWDRIVCTVAKAVVTAKFANVPGLLDVLLGTGDVLIAEATRNDRIWGIGVDKNQPEVADPAQWRGANILGWALMEARSTLRTTSGVCVPKRQNP